MRRFYTNVNDKVESFYMYKKIQPIIENNKEEKNQSIKNKKAQWITSLLELQRSKKQN